MELGWHCNLQCGCHPIPLGIVEAHRKCFFAKYACARAGTDLEFNIRSSEARL